MSGNTFGKLFSVTTFGESHGDAIGCIVDGCPPNISLSESDIQPDLNRRKPGQSHYTTQRKEDDEIRILSGIFDGRTTGTPIGLLIKNQDHKSKDYSKIKDLFRPSHADYTYEKKLHCPAIHEEQLSEYIRGVPIPCKIFSDRLHQTRVLLQNQPPFI